MKSYLKIIAILFLPLAFVVLYANSPVQIPPPGWKLSKIKAPLLIPESPTLSSSEKGKSASVQPKKKVRRQASSRKTEEVKTPENQLDTAAQRILFFGDSMVEGLLRRMNSYAFANGHKMTNVVWYGSTTEIWALTDTLRYFINKVEPTFAMISLGSNEQFIKDVEGRELFIREIVHELGNIPFVWIGVPAWKEDTGINKLTQRIVGADRYFDSRSLTLQRGSDRRHPTFSAASNWMDTVAVWMSSPATAHPIRMNKPAPETKHSFKTYALQPIIF